MTPSCQNDADDQHAEMGFRVLGHRKAPFQGLNHNKSQGLCVQVWDLEIGELKGQCQPRPSAGIRQPSGFSAYSWFSLIFIHFSNLLYQIESFLRAERASVSSPYSH